MSLLTFDEWDMGMGYDRFTRGQEPRKEELFPIENSKTSLRINEYLVISMLRRGLASSNRGCNRLTPLVPLATAFGKPADVNVLLRKTNACTVSSSEQYLS